MEQNKAKEQKMKILVNKQRESYICASILKLNKQC
jgi:hypothetical protein